MKKNNFGTDQAMHSLLKTASFQKNFEIPKLSSYDGELDSAVLKILDLSAKMERFGGQQASQQLLKIAQSILEDADPKTELEVCPTCGFDHEYDGAYPGVREKIERAHQIENENNPFDLSDEDYQYMHDVENKILKKRKYNDFYREYDPGLDEINTVNNCGDQMLTDVGAK